MSTGICRGAAARLVIIPISLQNRPSHITLLIIAAPSRARAAASNGRVFCVLSNEPGLVFRRCVDVVEAELTLTLRPSYFVTHVPSASARARA